MRDHFAHRDRLVRQEAPKLDLLGPAIAKLAQTSALPVADAPYHQRAVAGQSRVAEISDFSSHRCLQLCCVRALTNHIGLPRRNTAVQSDSPGDSSIPNLRYKIVLDYIIGSYSVIC
jgi:hypothetical protein